MSTKGARRIMQELTQLENEPSPDFAVLPVNDDLHNLHFVLRLRNDEFKDGIYHGRILLPPEYPLSPPEFYFLTPNGRFEPNKRICLSISGYHAESWQPAWGLRTALISISAFFATDAKGAIAGLDAPPDERRRLAKLSPDWTCPDCGKTNKELLPEVEAPIEAAPSSTEPQSFALEQPDATPRAAAPVPQLQVAAAVTP